MDPEFGVRRWSGKEKKIVEVTRPEIVHQYSLHLGGVNKNDMLLLSLYHRNTRTKKWYVQLVYYAIGISVVNGWLIYRWHWSMTQTPKKGILALKDFQYTVAMTLLQEGKEANCGKRGRPSLSAPVTKPKTNATIPVPAPEIRFNSVGHLPDFVNKQGRCRHCLKGFTSIQCVKCKTRLFITKNRSCFYNYHVPS